MGSGAHSWAHRGAIIHIERVETSDMTANKLFLPYIHYPRSMFSCLRRKWKSQLANNSATSSQKELGRDRAIYSSAASGINMVEAHIARLLRSGLPRQRHIRSEEHSVVALQQPVEMSNLYGMHNFSYISESYIPEWAVWPPNFWPRQRARSQRLVNDGRSFARVWSISGITQ